MCLRSFRDAALLQLPLKSLTVLDAASTLGLLGMLVRHAASKTRPGRPPPPSPPATHPHPHQQSPHCLWELVIVGLRSETRENSRGLAVRRHLEVSERERGRARGCEGGGEKKGKKFLSFPAGVFQIPQATAPQPREWSTQAEGKWKRAARGRGAHSWGDASPTPQQNRETFNLLLRLPHCVRGCCSSSSSSSSFFSLCRESPWRLILKTCSVCLIQIEAPQVCIGILWLPPPPPPPWAVWPLSVRAPGHSAG